MHRSEQFKEVCEIVDTRKREHKKDPDLTVSQIEKRLEFSLEMKGFLWDNVFITDECLFYLHRNTIKYWAKSKDKPHKKMAKFLQ